MDLMQKWRESDQEVKRLRGEVQRLEGELARSERHRKAAVQYNYELGYKAGWEDALTPPRKRQQQK